MRRVVRQLLERDIILIVLLIIAAILGAIGVPQSIGVTSDQIILALLGVLALDTLIERLGYLRRIEKHIANLESKVESRVSADNVFRTREEMRPFLPWLEECKEMWVLGKDLNELLSGFGGHFQQEAMKGKKRFRFLIVDPGDTKLMEVTAASSYLRPDAQSRQTAIGQAVAILKRMTESTPKDAVQVKLMNWLPTNSYVIADAHRESGRMVVEPFGYKITSAERRHASLTRAADSQTFAFHLRQFEKMWEDARPLADR